MATRLVDALALFEPSKMQWISYSERIEEYLVANSVDNPRKKVAILLSSIGDATYELLGDLCAPDKPNTKTFEELVEKLTEHFQPTPTVISERYKFHLRSQQTDRGDCDRIHCSTETTSQQLCIRRLLERCVTRQVCMWSR